MDLRKVERDLLVIKEAKVVALARLIGYNEIGEPIELTFDPSSKSYEWHVGGERVGEASQQSVEQFIPNVL